jgi:hypothetical protein
MEIKKLESARAHLTRLQRRGTDSVLSDMGLVEVHRVCRDLDIDEHALQLLGELVAALDL